MAKKKVDEEVEAVEAPRDLPKHDHAAVHSKDGQHVRTYSREVHGDNFEELAHEFADRRGHEVKVHS